MNDARPEITADGSTAAPEPANFRPSPVQGTPLTLEQRAALTELITDESNKALPEYVKRRIEHDRSKPAGEPEPPKKEEEDAILDYYRSGGKKPKPANADRFLYNEDRNTLTDLELENWLNNGGQEWEERDLYIHWDYTEILDNILATASSAAGIRYPGSAAADAAANGENLPVNNAAYHDISILTLDIISRVYASIVADIEQAEWRKAQATDKPPHLNSKPAKKHKMPNDPLTNALAGRYNPKTGEIEKVINAGAFDLPIGHNITAYTQVDMNGIIIDEGGDNFLPFDGSVLNAVCSLYEAGNIAITVKMVCRHLRNLYKGEYIKPEFEQRTKNSMEKLRRIHAKSNFSEILQGKTDLEGNPIKIKGYDDFLMVARIGLVEAGGKITECYFLTIEPLPLTVSKQTRQLITVDVKVLDIRIVNADGSLGKSLPVTDQRRQIVEYMTKRVGNMKNDRKNRRYKLSDIITFEAIYRESGANDGYTEAGTIKDAEGKTTQRAKKQANQKRYRQEIRKFVFDVLEYWKALKFIEGYEPIYERRKMHGVRILLAEGNRALK